MFSKTRPIVSDLQSKEMLNKLLIKLSTTQESTVHYLEIYSQITTAASDPLNEMRVPKIGVLENKKEQTYQDKI